MNTILAVALGALLTASSITDVRARKIPNLFTFSALAAFLAFHGLAPAGQGMVFALQGLGVGFCMFIGPYALGVLGAGDVKLMAAVGAALGPAAAFWAVLFTSLAGGAYALGVLACHPRALRRIASGLWHGVMGSAALRRVNYTPPAPDERLPKLPYGLAISAGAAAAALCTHFHCALPGL